MTPSKIEVKADVADFAKLAAAMATADTKIQKEITAALKSVAKPYGKYVVVKGASRLPKRGGLSYRAAGSPVSVNVSPMKVVVSARQVKALDAGIDRHPTFGHRDRWVTQHVTPRVFTDAFNEHAESVRPQLVAAGQKILDDIKAAV